MATFKDVFNITWKVVLSLVIVSVIAGAAYMLLRVFGEVAKEVAKKETAGAAGKEIENRYDTSDYHTKMPKSVWDKQVAWAVEHHCHFAGMSKEEIIRALGQPTEEKDYALTYAWETKDCARYDGDACVEYKKGSKIIFLRNGHRESFQYGTDEDCDTLSGEYGIRGLKIPTFPTQEAIQKANSEAQAKLATQQAAEAKEAARKEAGRKELCKEAAFAKNESFPCTPEERRAAIYNFSQTEEQIKLAQEQIKLAHQRAVFKECLASHPTATLGSPEYNQCLRAAQE